MCAHIEISILLLFHLELFISRVRICKLSAEAKSIELIIKDRKFDKLLRTDRTKYKLIYISGCSYKKMIEMRLINIIRRITIAAIILLIVVILEAAYFGLHETTDYSANGSSYSVAAPFIINFSDLSSPTNIIFLVIVFIISFMIVSNIIAKKKASRKAMIKQVRK